MQTHERYAAVNGAWPVERKQLPAMTAAEAKKAFRILYRHRFGKPWTNQVIAVKGRRRRTWTRHVRMKRGTKLWREKGTLAMIVAPDSGWHDFIHDLSHWIHARQYPDQNAHKGSSHPAVEIDLIEQVVNRGWLEGKLKSKRVVREKPKVVLKEVRHMKVLDKLKSWQTKLKRAQTAIKKLQKQKAYYER